MPHRIPALVMFVVLCLGITVASAAAPVAQEPAGSTHVGGYPREWPAGPQRSSVPDWAGPGLMRFARWDGGPIEVAKGFLSGWPGLNPPIPDYIYTMANWYDPATVKLLRDARVNFVWVTLSVGFSIPTEKVQGDLLKSYIDECHRHGIRVLAYESVANLFWEDMFANMPESKNWILKSDDGTPVPYGAGDYSKMGRVTRYMADLSKAGWRDLLKKRIDLAIEAKADGVMYDNVLVGNRIDTVNLFAEIMQYSLGRKKDFLLMANLHRDNYSLNRLLNCITTEDGGESGVFSKENLDRTRRAREREYLLPVEGGFLVNNIGLFRTFENLSEGWKPVMIESNFREVGVRETHFMRPERQQRSIAEPMMFGVSNELFVELRFAHDLWRKTPEAVAAWKAIGQYYGFMAEHTEYYRGARSVATLAIVLDNRSEGQAVMNGLAARNVLYHVLYEHELTAEKLKPYAAVVLLSAETVRDRALTALKDYLTGGGKLFAIAPVVTKDGAGKARSIPDWFGKPLGRGEAKYLEKLPPIDDLAKTLLAADRPPLAKLHAPPGVLCNVTQQPAKGRLMIHLLNYLPHAVDNVVVTVEGKHERVELLTPDDARQPPRIVRASETHTQIELPRLKLYSVLVLKAAK